jgi:hypothetical protein
MRQISRIIIAVFVICAAAVTTWGDVLPDGHHNVFRDAAITNLNEYPELALIGYITGPTLDTAYEAYRIEENVPLYAGYKFNQLRLFAMPTSVFEEAGGLDNIDMQKVAQTFPSIEMVSFYDTVSDSNPLKAERYYYRITAAAESGITLTLYQRVLSYNNGQADTTITY